MGKRGFSYYSCLIFREYVVGLPSMFFEFLGHCFGPFELICGIRVVDPADDTRPYFANAVAKALELIATSDPVRFRRVQRSIRSIVNTATPKYASCSGPPFKVCSVNFRGFYYPEFEKTVKFLAAALVYGASRNYLIKRGILVSKANRDRIAALRSKELWRFKQRIGIAETPPASKNLISEPPEHLFKEGLKEIYGIFRHDPANEAKIWKEQVSDPEKE